MYNTQNHGEQGGSRTVIDGELVINGKLIIGEDAVVEGLLPIPTVIEEPHNDGTAAPSPFLMQPCENQSLSHATTVAALRDEFNLLLTNLKDAGLMEPDGDPDA
jgi:hypothetical protein